MGDVQHTPAAPILQLHRSSFGGTRTLELTKGAGIVPSDRNRGQLRTTLRICLLLIGAALLFGACGDDDDGSSGGTADQQGAAAGVREARELVAKFEAPVPFEAPGPAFDASEASGKTVAIVALGLTIPFTINIANGIEDGLAAAGVDAIKYDGKFQVTEQTRAFQQAIARDVDAIVFIAIAPSLLSAQIADAKQAGIPVISQGVDDPGVRVPGEEEGSGVVATATHCYSCAGRMMADAAIADSNGKANIVAIWSSDIPDTGKFELDGIEEELDKRCPDCEFKTHDVPFAKWDSLTTGVQSIMREDPSVDYFLPLYDGMALFVVPGIHAARAEDKVKVVSFNATPAVMKFMAQGDVVVADVGSAQVRQGWATADQILRVLTDTDPVDDIKVPLRLFTESNIDSIDLDAQESTWYSDDDWKSEYEQLWGLSE